jgi:hypothetical protein
MNKHETNHLLPFLWVHGESAETYRKMVKAIHNANIGAFCVEARPHPEFGREQWWQDMGVILDEAERLDMRVWILDDKHFPTGYANGGLEKAPPELRRRNICCRSIDTRSGSVVRLNLNRLIHPRNSYNFIALFMLFYGNNKRFPKKQKDDHLLSCTAFSEGKWVDLSPHIKNGKLRWNAPVGDWSIEVCSLSANTGMHRSYINMMDKDSCRIQIDEVYEPHFRHFGDKFGKTIVGFFSDEPELGNGDYTKHYNYLGTAQDLPYSRELADRLEQKLGGNWKSLLPLLWKNDYDRRETARVRYIYMDSVTRLVERNFSQQIGEWCTAHGVEYIGHIIEDNNQHARTSTSLGHFFRGLKWQTMAGIDDIGGQVYPGGEDNRSKSIFGFINDGEFYHYTLGKLGSSLAALNPRMQGRAFCEIFGNYGWSEGVHLEKYLVDHFMVRGINYFVPHAFTCKPYPDKDCPPHFYAHGHNPQYRHFGALMKYVNRVCNMISGGYIETPIAILYHAEAEWSGAYMLMQKPARVLLDNQINFNFVPADVFSERDFYHSEITGKLTINDRTHHLLLIPSAQYITLEVAEGITELLSNGCLVAFIDMLPEGICTGESLPLAISRCDVVPLNGLLSYVEKHRLRGVRLVPENSRIRGMHYINEHAIRRDIWYLFNEGNNRYQGTVTLPATETCYGYDAWDDHAYKLDCIQKEESVEIAIVIDPGKSVFIAYGCEMSPPENTSYSHKIELHEFTQSVCKSIDYPRFSHSRYIYTLESYHLIDKKFSGFIRYQTNVKLPTFKKAMLEITDAHEGVEVFVNGTSTGIQVIPVFMFDITEFCEPGNNELIIEVATTLEREQSKGRKGGQTGITGNVTLHWNT